MRLIVDKRPFPFQPGDSVLIAMLRAGEHPTGGGCLCLGGDCPHCIATVDGVSYVRTCQVPARPGLVIERHPADGKPPMPDNDVDRQTAVSAHNLFVDVVVIGGGQAGQAAVADAKQAGKTVLLLDAEAGQEAIGIYHGPLVVARTADGMLHVHAREEVIVATGAAEIQPVAPGNELAGLFTERAISQLTAAGVELGRIVAVGQPPETGAVIEAVGQLVRFEGEGGRVTAVVTVDEAGHEHFYPCNAVSLGLGLHPRDALRRMGHDLPVRAVGDAALDSDIPPCPAAGTVCPCAHVTVADLDDIWQRGFTELELVKRGTLAGTGTCQGMACLPHIRSFLADRGQELQPPFTARPVNRQITLGEIAAGAQLQATARTALDGEHRRLGAQMERSGGWWRPWNYGDVWAEYWAVREAVSVMDVSTLGKLIITGPDVRPFLDKLYPTNIKTLKNGRLRYALLLNERGYVQDDGLIVMDHDHRAYLTFTSGGATYAEAWVRDWAAGFGLDVRIMNVTHSFAALNVTGPLTAALLKQAGVDHLPRFLHHAEAAVAGVPCRLLRLSFTGELSIELHFPVQQAVTLWRELLALGRELGIRPHGLQALLTLRLEKGHIIVGQDTDFDSTPRRLDHEWMVHLDKPEFVGRYAVERTNRVPLDKQLVGLSMDGPPPIEGANIWHDDQFVGHVTSATWSPRLNRSLMLGWVRRQNGRLPTQFTIDQRPASLTDLPFYDKEGRRAKAATD